MRRKIQSCIALLGALSMAASLGVQMASATETDYPDMEVGVFWNSDSDRSDTVYMSYNGADFQQISTAYKADGNGSTHVSGKPSYVNAIHDPSITYKDGTFWILAAMCRSRRTWDGFTPMMGYSKDLVNWSYPNSGSPTNLAPSVMPYTNGLKDGQYDSAGTDGFVNSHGDMWIVTTLGYYGDFHGNAQKDYMYPYIVKVSGLQPGADPAVDPGAQPRLSYGSLNPIKLPDTKTSNWLDPSLFEVVHGSCVLIEQVSAGMLRVIVHILLSMSHLADCPVVIHPFAAIGSDILHTFGHSAGYLVKYQPSYR